MKLIILFWICQLFIGCSASDHIRHRHTILVTETDSLEVRQCEKFNCLHLDTFYLKAGMWRK